MNTYAQMIEDEAGEPFGIYYDQVQADYHRLFDLGVNDGTHAALYVKGLITIQELYDEQGRSYDIDHSHDGDSTYWEPYQRGRDAAYANTCTPEIMSCFEVKA